MTIPKIQLNSFRSIFSGNPQELYLAYNEKLDGLSIYLIPPDEFVSSYALNDSIAVLADDHNRVVGFQLNHFVSRHLNAPELKALKDTWETKDLAHEFSRYKYFYSPTQKSEESNELVRALFQRSGTIPRVSGEGWF